MTALLVAAGGVVAAGAVVLTVGFVGTVVVTVGCPPGCAGAVTVPLGLKVMYWVSVPPWLSVTVTSKVSVPL